MEKIVYQFEAVFDFAKVMYRNLENNSHKSGWGGLSHQWCANRIGQELSELKEAIRSGNSERIISESADVANFCMMIADNERKKRNESPPNVPKEKL